MNPDLITVQQACEILGVSRPAVQQRIDSGSIKPVARFGRAYMLSRQAIEKLKPEIKKP
jgi:DNA binding domain, excisionase family